MIDTLVSLAITPIGVALLWYASYLLYNRNEDYVLGPIPGIVTLFAALLSIVYIGLWVIFLHDYVSLNLVP